MKRRRQRMSGSFDNQSSRIFCLNVFSEDFRFWLCPFRRTKGLLKCSTGKFYLTKVMRSGATPYGYCYLDGQLVVDDKEQQILHRIVEMRTNGQSFRAIARALNDQRKPTRHGKTWKHEVVKQIYIRARAKPCNIDTI